MNSVAAAALLPEIMKTNDTGAAATATAAAVAAASVMEHNNTQTLKIKKCALNTKKYKKFSNAAKKILNTTTTTTTMTRNRFTTATTIMHNNNNNNNNNDNINTKIATTTTTTTAPHNLTCSRSSIRIQQDRQMKLLKQQQHQQKLDILKQQNERIKEQQRLQQLQIISPLTQKETFLLNFGLLAVVRRNASDKLKLIQMVHDNPILWDSRLPNFKGAEEEKNHAWEQIGQEFNAPGRRVARAFKSLRESYRRELAHVKLMGNGFKPKWSLYDAMDFLRDVIRERKGGSHAAEHCALGALTHHLSSGSVSNHGHNNNIKHHNNNNNSSNINNNNNNNSKATAAAAAAVAAAALKFGALHSSFNETAALNLTKSSPTLIDDFYGYAKSEPDLSPTGNGHLSHHQHSPHAAQLHQQAILPAHQHYNNNHHNHNQHHQRHQQQHHQHQHQQQHDSRVSSTRNDTTQNTTFDDLDGSSSMRSGDEVSIRNDPLSHQGSDEVEELEAIDADFPYPLILDSNSPISGGSGVHVNGVRALNSTGRSVGNGGHGDNALNGLAGPNGSVGGIRGGSMTPSMGGGIKRRRKHQTHADDDDDDDADDEYEGQMLQQHRHLRQQNAAAAAAGILGGGMMGMEMPPPQTVREVLNSKFCGFISAKLNSMEDTEADNLMNKILMLLVQSQQPLSNNDSATTGAAGHK